ncbi:hypothetical protein ACSBR1_004988 [Camellia fascicularis]
MYMAYGWPQIIPLEYGLCPSEQIIFLKLTNGLLLLVAPSHLELWSSSQHKVRLGKYKRDIRIRFKEKERIFRLSNIVCDNKHMLIGLSDGSLYNIPGRGSSVGPLDFAFTHMMGMKPQNHHVL